MRIKVDGSSNSVTVLKGYLKYSGFVPSNLNPWATVHIDENEQDFITIDSVDGDLERLVINYISELISNPIQLNRFSGVKDNHEIRIVIPTGEEKIADVVERGLLRALQFIAKLNQPIDETSEVPPGPVPIVPRVMTTADLMSASADLARLEKTVADMTGSLEYLKVAVAHAHSESINHPKAHAVDLANVEFGLTKLESEVADRLAIAESTLDYLARIESARQGRWRKYKFWRKE